MTPDQFKVLIERIDSIQGVVDRIENDIDKIYKDNQELSIRVGAAENQLRAFKDILNNIPKDVKSQVTEANKPIEDLTEEIKKKKFIAINSGRSWWKFW